MTAKPSNTYDLIVEHGGAMRGYVVFLRRPYAGRLLGATLLGRLPNGMGMLAVVLHVRSDGGGYPLAGTLAAIQIGRAHV